MGMTNFLYEGGNFGTVASEHVQVDYFVRPSAPPVDILEDEDHISCQDSDGGLEMQEYESPSSPFSKQPDGSVTKHLVKSPDIASGSSYQGQGRPKPKGKVRRTEELRKKRHQSRKEKELSGWRHFLCSLWRWNQKTAKSPREPTVYRPYFIIIISIVDIIVLAAEIGINKGIESLSVNPLVGPSEQTLLDLGAKYGPYMKSGGGAWRFFAPIVMHVGIIHLLVNLCSQLQMIPLEKQYGCQRIIPIYLLSGIASVLSSVIFVPNLVMVGASGSIFGLIGVLGIDLIQNWKCIKYPFFHAAIWVISVLISLAIGLLPGIDNFAHVGGFIQGIIGACIFLPMVGQPTPSGKKRWTLTLVCIPIDILLIIGAFLAWYLAVPADQWCSFCRLVVCLPFFSWC